jgi:protein involved in polysaccharide export with SLBB domain
MKSSAASVLAAWCAIALWACLGPGTAAAQSDVLKYGGGADVGKKRSAESAIAEDEAATSERAATVPILEKAVDPDNYVLGPFDRLAMTIMGPDPRTTVLTVLPEGDVLVPGIGAIRADGLTITEFRRSLAASVDRVFRNIELYCYLETPAQFRVFVTGEVASPGVVLVSGVERVADALEKADGIGSRGSRRSIELERAGSTVRVDLARFLSQGDLEGNPFLRSGDRIHVPPAGWRAVVSGRVNKQNEYEIFEGETISDLIALAGGFEGEAIRDSVLLKRVDAGGEVTTSVVEKARFDMPLADGDEIGVYDALKDRRYVTVSGAMFRTGQFELARGEGIASLLVRTGGFRATADLSAAYVERKSGSVLKVDLAEYLSPDPLKDLPLENGDALTVPEIASKITVGGLVNEPGEFPYSSDLTVVQYIGLAGGPSPDGGVERVLVYSVDGSRRRAESDERLNRGDVIVVQKSGYAIFGDLFDGMLKIGALVVSILILSE